MATKTKTKTKTDEAPREHKKPWQETFATPEEIKAMVSNHVLLRYNEVRGLTEVHWLSEGPVIQEDEQGLLSIFGEEGGVTDGYTTLTTPFDYDGIYAQAYALYQEGFQYWFSSEEIQQLTQHNRQFETSCTERDLVFWNFRLPRVDEEGEFIPVALAMQIVGANISQKISKEAMGHAFIDLGFERKTYRNVRGYVAVRRTQQEIDLMRKGLAIATDNDTHTLDTPFF